MSTLIATFESLDDGSSYEDVRQSAQEMSELIICACCVKAEVLPFEPNENYQIKVEVDTGRAGCVASVLEFMSGRNVEVRS